MKDIIKIFKLFLLFTSLVFSSCKKFVAVDAPKTGLVDASIFNSKTATLAAISGIFSDMQSSYGFASGSSSGVGHICGLSADELVNYSQSLDDEALYQNVLTPLNGSLSGSCWNNPYYYIYQCNDIIAGITASTAFIEADKNALIGEAKFVRAFCYFYLTNLYGDVPLYLTTDYKANQSMGKAAQKDVYKQIIIDLKEAQTNMQVPSAQDTRILPNSDVATALLARVYLYNEDYQNAITEATKLINSTARYQLLPDVNGVFLKESKEAIWQLQPVIPGQNTNEGADFILTTAPSNAALNSSLVNAFEEGDMRRSAWIDSIVDNNITYYFPYKYKVLSSSTLTEYSMVLRLAEQYLIRAEAKAMTGDLPGAVGDVNIIRQRAGLNNISAGGQAELLLAIERERRVELFTEWGHRWLDLKRTNRATAVLGNIKPSWKPTAILYPIPQNEINANPHITQNPGY